jgi:RNA polymerase sigma factor (sigma-70 family)
MKMDESEIVKFIEPIFHFCVKRLNNRHDAEDLTSEIMVHILNGMKKYHIDSLEKWVWRIAHNRYARFIDIRNKQNEMPSNDDFANIPDDYDFVDEMFIVDEYQQVFQYLHALSSEYRNIFVDYYIGQLTVKQIAKNYALTETTIKWRLNISREKIKKRIGAREMDKVYKRINWNTGTCNGNIDVNKYLFNQVARAICEAVYEKPLTVEEISIKTGLPAMYIEDELPRLIHGEAIVKEGAKYATNFIILRLCDKKVMITKFAPLVDSIADYFSKKLSEHESDVVNIGFTGSDFGTNRLGYIALSFAIRAKTEKVMESLNMRTSPFPLRLDGGYGWFIVDEKETENESLTATESGCNSSGDAAKGNFIYYYWIGKYFQRKVSRDANWLAQKNTVANSENGVIRKGAINEEDIIRLMQSNLIIKDGDLYKLNFAIFTPEQFNDFKGLFDKGDTVLDKLLSELISDMHRSFKAFVPKRLDNQINQYVSGYVHNIIGFVAEELINRGVLEKPDEEKPCVNGVFSITGKYLNV